MYVSSSQVVSSVTLYPSTGDIKAGTIISWSPVVVPGGVFADTYVVPSDTSSVDISVSGGSAYNFVVEGDFSADAELRMRVNSDTGSNYCWSAITSASHGNVCSTDFVRLTRDGGDVDRLSFVSSFTISDGLSSIAGNFSGYRFSSTGFSVSGNSDGSFMYVGSSQVVSSVTLYPSTGDIKAGTIISWSPVVVSGGGSSGTSTVEVDLTGLNLGIAFILFFLSSGFFIFYFKRK